MGTNTMQQPRQRCRISLCCNQLNTAHCTLKTELWANTAHSAQYILNTELYTLLIENATEHSEQCTLHTVNCTLQYDPWKEISKCLEAVSHFSQRQMCNVSKTSCAAPPVWKLVGLKCQKWRKYRPTITPQKGTYFKTVFPKYFRLCIRCFCKTQRACIRLIYCSQWTHIKFFKEFTAMESMGMGMLLQMGGVTWGRLFVSAGVALSSLNWADGDAPTDFLCIIMLFCRC